MGHRVRTVDPRAPVAGLLGLLSAALDGGPALLPRPARHPGPGAAATAGPPPEVPDGVALVLPTSGSTGTPRLVELTGAALAHSARATHDRLGGPGRWLLALPLTHVAGWQVLVRSHVAGLAPAVADTTEGFDADRFATAASGMRGPRRYTSLVPTQLARLLDDEAATAAAARLDAVLLGGAAAPAALLARARSAGVRVVTTYGMTETCGGCVYDGVPLDGVRVEVDADGRLLLCGPVLARGYADGPDPAFARRDGERWFVTADAGRQRPDGTWEVLGRLDDVIVTGGEKVAPAAVEDALTGVAGVAECVVVGVPDGEWGQAVTAVVVARPGARPTAEAVRDALRDRLPAAALPRHVVLTGTLPSRGPGKPDRAAAADLARRALAADG